MRGFTFSQVAVIILVILGLTVVVVIAAVSLAQSGASFGELSSKTDTGSVSINLGIQCLAAGGYCATSGDCTDAGRVAGGTEIDDCGDTKVCCVEST